MTKIWVMSSNRWNSAITEYALSLARASALNGWKVVFSPLFGSPAAQRAEGYGLDVVPFKSFGLSDAPRIAWAAGKIAADVVIPCGGEEASLVMLPPVRRRARVVRFRGQSVEDRLFGGIRQKLGHAHVDMIMTPSEAMAAQLRTLDPMRPVRVVTLGVDGAKFTRKKAAADAAFGGRPEILILGRFDPVKGHAAAMDLLQAVLATPEGARLRPCLRIVGEPANLSAADLEGFARARGLAVGDDVKITPGRVEDVAALLSAAVVGLVPSLGSEVICRVSEEFLLCGTPVVVSGVGSLDEVLAFEGAGGSYGDTSIGGAAETLLRWTIIGNEEGAGAKELRAQSARERFTLQAMSQRLAAVLAGQ